MWIMSSGERRFDKLYNIRSKTIRIMQIWQLRMTMLSHIYQRMALSLNGLQHVVIYNTQILLTTQVVHMMLHKTILQTTTDVYLWEVSLTLTIHYERRSLKSKARHKLFFIIDNMSRKWSVFSFLF